MRKLLTGDHISFSRGGVARHALSATTLLLVGFLVVALTQLGGGPSSSMINRGLMTPTTSCDEPPQTVTLVGNHVSTTHPKTVTKTAWKTKTVYKTKTVTVTRTRTRTVCKTVTATTTEPGSTTTVTTTVTGSSVQPTLEY
jgi:hypothetical protein